MRNGNINKWKFSPNDLTKTPSVTEGFTEARERVFREKGCTFIYRVSVSLEMECSAIATAYLFFHMFYMRESLQRNNIYDVAGACIFLASKLSTNSIRKINSVVVACIRKALKNDNLVLQETDKEVILWRKNILFYEETVLNAINYDTQVELPYDILLEWSKKNYIPKKVLQAAWCFINDSFRFALCICYHPNELAATALYVASRLLREPLSVLVTDSHKTIFDVSFNVIEEMTNQFLQSYPNSPMSDLSRSPETLGDTNNHSPAKHISSSPQA
ncbi:hypothetical protein HK099_005670 [Clydaea vesicula]|uniref:Cyclin-like domain-containing protein n=1 Tax=Clydaea vesicula TaxID=447962 RepID=A0AAD5U1C2_9FUNG|nr:hypothetical protein HK099_005670 [Clydaea vesicula]KAJ3380268.1 hypothetical protein HDU92_006077 [Lobulomyces angularis]